MSKNFKSRNVIKSLVKECLIEILAEGLIGGNTATTSETREMKGSLYEANERLEKEEKTNTSRPKPATSKRQSYLDSITAGVDNVRGTKNTDALIKEKVSSLTQDPIMSDIFADTAMTTLREQKENGRNSGPSVATQGDSAAKVVDQSLPEDLFGGAASKWANLAFAPSARKS
jgi:hypothetical protein